MFEGKVYIRFSCIMLQFRPFPYENNEKATENTVSKWLKHVRSINCIRTFCTGFVRLGILYISDIVVSY